MREREKFNIGEAKERIFKRDGYKCQCCGNSIYIYNSPQLAHLVSQGKRNLRKYGAEIIHSDLNMKACCSLVCNGRLAVGLSREKQKAEEIRRIIDDNTNT